MLIGAGIIWNLSRTLNLSILDALLPMNTLSDKNVTSTEKLTSDRATSSNWSMVAAIFLCVTFLFVPGQSWAQAGLVAAYAFNEGAGTTVTDLSGNGNTGTIGGASWTTAGKFGNALVFDGTSAQVTIPNSTSLRLTTAMTLEAWVYPTTTPTSWRAVIDKNVEGYYLMASSKPGNRPAVRGTWARG